MRLHSSASVHLRLSVCVHVHLRACVSAQKIKRPDASRRKKFLRPDASFVQGLSGCTIISVSELSGIRFSFPNIPVSEF